MFFLIDPKCKHEYFDMRMGTIEEAMLFAKAEKLDVYIYFL